MPERDLQERDLLTLRLFARIQRAYGRIDDLSAMLDLLAETIVQMVRELRKGVEMRAVKAQNDELQRIEGEGDKLMLESLQQLYQSKCDPFQAMLMKDLLEIRDEVAGV